MTDVKKLRELAVAAFKYDSPFTIREFQAAANPQAIIELLDMVDQYREALTTIQTWSSYPNRIFEIGVARVELSKINKMASEALEGGK